MSLQSQRNRSQPMQPQLVLRLTQRVLTSCKLFSFVQRTHQTQSQLSRLNSPTMTVPTQPSLAMCRELITPWLQSSVEQVRLLHSLPCSISIFVGRSDISDAKSRLQQAHRLLAQLQSLLGLQQHRSRRQIPTARSWLTRPDLVSSFNPQRLVLERVRAVVFCRGMLIA